MAARNPLPLRIAYHDACHLRHAQGIHQEPRQLLAGIPGLEVAEIAESSLCCGSAGVYNLLQPEPAQQLGDRKVTHLLATHAAAVVSANPGCLLQLMSGLRRRGEQELAGVSHGRVAGCIHPRIGGGPTYCIANRSFEHDQFKTRRLIREEESGWWTRQGSNLRPVD